MSTTITAVEVKKQDRQRKRTWVRNHWQLYMIVLVPLIWVIIFRYLPMYGITIAFKDYRIREGMLASPWADPWFKHFSLFFSSPLVGRLIINTLVLSFYSTLAGFLPPILLAIFLNECRNPGYKRFVQMVTYAPHFISTVLIIGIRLCATLSMPAVASIGKGSARVDRPVLIMNDGAAPPCSVVWPEGEFMPRVMRAESEIRAAPILRFS